MLAQAATNPWFALVLPLVLACREGKNDYADLALSRSEIAKVTELQRLFEGHRQRLARAYVATDGCNVYRSQEEAGVVVAWEPVNLPRQGYPNFMTSCSGMTMGERDPLEGFQYFRFCGMAIGAGGGCQRSGEYRTRDGFDWECKAADGWVPCEG